jgi:hypothetical protein
LLKVRSKGPVSGDFLPKRCEMPGGTLCVCFVAILRARNVGESKVERVANYLARSGGSARLCPGCPLGSIRRRQAWPSRHGCLCSSEVFLRVKRSEIKTAARASRSIRKSTTQDFTQPRVAPATSIVTRQNLSSRFHKSSRKLQPRIHHLRNTA